MKRNSTKDRRRCFDENKFIDETGRPYLRCANPSCKVKIDPVKDEWQADHCTPHAWAGEALQPLCITCHKAKTKKDVKAIAKVKRVHDQHHGIKRSKVPLPGGKMSPWKRKLNGEWVRRDEDK